MRTASLVYAFQGSQIESYSKDNRFFIKFFLLDASLNKNKWRVAWEAIKEYHADFVGKPFIILPNKSHPYPKDPEAIFQAQKPYQKGKIIETGLDEQQKKAWAIAEITDPEAQRQIQSGEIKFVSPSMLSYNHQIMFLGEEKIILGFEAAHVAGVSNPAYGVLSAQIKGTCACADGQCEVCMNTLKMVQASDENSLEITKNLIKAESECVAKWIDELANAHPEWEHDQVIAVAYSKCYGSSEGSVVNAASTTIQTYIFDKSKFTNAEAKAWLERHDKNTGLEETEDSYRARQIPPTDFIEGSFRTIEIAPGIKGVIGKLKSENKSGNLASYGSYKHPKIKKKSDMSGNEDIQKTLESLKADLESTKTDLKTTKEKHQADITKLQSERDELKQKLDAEQRKPVIAKILEAKTKLNIKADKEEEELAKLSMAELNSIAKQYDSMASLTEPNAQGRFPAPFGFNADVPQDTLIKNSNALLIKLNGRFIA